MQGSLFPVPSDWKAPTEFPRIEGQDIGVDTETHDILFNTRGPGWAFDVSREIRGEIVGIGVATLDAKWYFPIGHEDGGNLDREPVLRFVQDVMDRNKRIYMHNASYDCGWLSAEGIKVDYARIHDTAYLAALADENRRSYSLDNCAETWCGINKDEKMLNDAAASYGFKKKDVKSNLWRLHSRYVGPYGEQDPWVTLQLGRKLEQIMQEEHWEKAYELERRMIPLMIQMRKTGVRIDMDRADQVRQIFIGREREALALIQKETGLRARAGVPSADASQILKKLGVSIPVTAAGNESVVASWLERVDHPVAKAIVRARKNNKAYRDFIDGQIGKYQVNGRIHASFHPLRSDEGGTVTGRFSCTDPNLQQVPARDPEIGPLVRSCYVGEEGEKWCAPDYSSQEPRWTLHFAAAIKAPGALAATQRFWDNPRTDFHGMMAETIWPDIDKSSSEFKKKRRNAKDIFLGLCYGMGGAKLCDSLGLPTDIWVTPTGDRVRVAGEAGKELLGQFNRMAPFVKKLAEEVKNRAESRGWVMTHFGRRCRIKDFGHKGLNRIVQGSSADQGKAATLAVWEQMGKVPLLLVHDENGYSVSGQEEGNKIARIMETCIPNLNVPFVVDPTVVDNWGQAK